jgi:hypothetical protein
VSFGGGEGKGSECPDNEESILMQVQRDPWVAGRRNEGLIFDQPREWEAGAKGGK